VLRWTANARQVKDFSRVWQRLLSIAFDAIIYAEIFHPDCQGRGTAGVSLNLVNGAQTETTPHSKTNYA
jgi:hypothetical protein